MHCYYVLVHGLLAWNVPPSSQDVEQPKGFYCHRYVLASSYEKAAEMAFKKVRSNLDRDRHWISDGSATLTLEAEEVSRAPMYRLLRPDNPGHSFYVDE